MSLIIDEKSLIDKIVSGDTDAENRLFLHFKERIEFLVRVRLRNKVSYDDQKDILSEARQAILFSLRKGGFDSTKGKPLEAYIAGIVSNVVALHFRKLKKEKQTDDFDSHHNVSSGSNQLSDILDEEKKEKVRLCLSRIKGKYKDVLIMRIYEDKSINEIASQLGIEKRRVSERINYAFKLLMIEIRKENYFQYLEPKSK